MYGLTSTLQVAAQALNAESGAIAVTNTNIANVNTVGYSRQTVNLSPAAVQGDAALQEDGVAFSGFSSVRDQVLQLTINQTNSSAGALNTKSALWSQIEGAYSGTTTGLGAAFTSLFTSLTTLSSSPTNVAAQQTVLGSASQLVDAFHQAASALTGAQASANQAIAGTVDQINQLSTQIASMDQQVTTLHNQGQDGGTVEDQRDALTAQLSQLVGLNSITTEAEPTLALSNGTPLVSNGTAYALHINKDAQGNYQVEDAQGRDLTSNIQGGSLGGAVSMRDVDNPQLQGKLDQLASDFGTSLNAVQAQGSDGSGAAGQPMLSLPTGASGAAASISLNLTAPSQLALNSNGSSQDSGNLSAFLALQTQPLTSGMTATDSYADLVQSIGTGSASTSASLTATNANLAQLTTQQRSESGVSIDEETTNLLRYQQAYSAAAQVISTVNNLFSVVLNMSTVTS